MGGFARRSRRFRRISFGTGRSAPKTVGRRAFRDARMITGNLPIVPTREMLTATNRPANASSMLSGGRQEQYFTKSQPAAAPQSFDKEAAQVQESIEGTGQLGSGRGGHASGFGRHGATHGPGERN